MDQPLIITLDVSELIRQHEDLASQIEEKTIEAVGELSAQTHAHIIEEAQQKLHSRREQFIQTLKIEEIEKGVWGITIPSESIWIEDGLKAGFDMLPGFLSSSKAKTGRGGKYLIIPFKHNKAPSQQTPLQKALSSKIKKELGKKNIPYGKIEKGPDGSAKLGLLHKLDVKDPKIGKENKQSPWKLGSGPIKSKDVGTGPFLKNVRIYQREVEGSHNTPSIKKDIMTFRTASEKHSGSKWLHSGIEPGRFFDEAYQWAEKQWEEGILPRIIQELGISDV